MREIIYDAMLTPTEGIADLMGLPPISSEVAEMEEQASQDRLSNIAALLPFIDAHADIAAKIATSAYMLDEENAEDITQEQLDQRLVNVACDEIHLGVYPALQAIPTSARQCRSIAQLPVPVRARPSPPRQARREPPSRPWASRPYRAP